MAGDSKLGRCSRCGANMDFVGKAHRCVVSPVTAERNASPAKPASVTKSRNAVTAERNAVWPCPTCGQGPPKVRAKTAAERMRAHRARQMKGKHR